MNIFVLIPPIPPNDQLSIPLRPSGGRRAIARSRKLVNPGPHLRELLIDDLHDPSISQCIFIQQVIAVTSIGHDEYGVRLGRGQWSAGSEIR